LIATLGKLIPAYAAVRLGGLRRQDAATVAALVDTRGLSELIALNAELTSGIIGRQHYTIFVLMAFATTALTSPLLALLRSRPVTSPDNRHATTPSSQQGDS